MSPHSKLTQGRIATFAIIAGSVVDDDDNPIQDAEVTIEDQKTTTDADGKFRLVFPVEMQSEIKPINITKKGFIDIYCEDESPSILKSRKMRVAHKRL